MRVRVPAGARLTFQIYIAPPEHGPFNLTRPQWRVAQPPDSRFGQYKVKLKAKVKVKVNVKVKGQRSRSRSKVKVKGHRSKVKVTASTPTPYTPSVKEFCLRLRFSTL